MLGRDGGLTLEDLHAGYGGRRVLHGVSLEAPPGVLTGLIGPNGSGKTTLVRVASRGLAPQSGLVRIAGQDPYRLPARRAARLVAVVPQELAPAFSFSVLELVLMGRSPYLSPWGGGRAEDWQRARQAMAATNVQHLADRPIEELSGGERQRVVLAQALAQDAAVLLLDEPTTHLDVRHVIEILSVVRGLAVEQGTAVLAIFHDLNLASAFCDRLYALAHGQVVAAGDPGAVLTGTLVREVFGVEAEVMANPSTGRPAVIPVLPAGGRPSRGDAPRVHVIGGAGRAGWILRALAERGWDVSTGVLHVGDTDQGVAERLNIVRVTVPPFSPVDPRSVADCAELIRGASLLVLCDAPFGPGNVANLHLALDAARSGVRTVLLEESPIEERDFTGGEATAAWRSLHEIARVAANQEALLEATESARAGR